MGTDKRLKKKKEKKTGIISNIVTLNSIVYDIN